MVLTESKPAPSKAMVASTGGPIASLISHLASAAAGEGESSNVDGFAALATAETNRAPTSGALLPPEPRGNRPGRRGAGGFLPVSEADAWAVADRGVIARDGTSIWVRGVGRQAVEIPAHVIRETDELRCGAQHCCAFTPGVTGVQCFGDNTDGQAGGNYERPGPVEVQGNVTELALGVTTSCALTDLGVECWGANDHLATEAVHRIRPVDHLSAGGSRLFCSSGRDNAPWALSCWNEDGGDVGGVPGARSPTPTPIFPPLDMTPIGLIASDALGTCGVYGRNGDQQCVLCLGANRFGSNEMFVQLTPASGRSPRSR